MKRHRWGTPWREHGSWRSRCTRCCMLRDKRFCYGSHWTEYQELGGTWQRFDKTPPCNPGGHYVADDYGRVYLCAPDGSWTTVD